MPGQGEISLNNTSEILSLSGGDVYNSSDHDFVTSGDEDTGLGSDRTATPPRLDADAPADNIIPRARRDAAEEARQRTAAYLATENASLEQVRHLYDVVFSDSSCDESGDTSGSFDQLGPTQVPNNNKENNKRRNKLKKKSKPAAAAAAKAAAVEEGASQSFAAFSKNAKNTSTPTKWARPNFGRNAAGGGATAKAAAYDVEDLDDTRILGSDADNSSHERQRRGSKRTVKGESCGVWY
jgi:hypothetical protein